VRRIGKRCRFERSMLGCSLSRNTNMDVFYYGNEYVIFHSSGKHDMSSTFGCLYELVSEVVSGKNCRRKITLRAALIVQIKAAVLLLFY